MLCRRNSMRGFDVRSKIFMQILNQITKNHLISVVDVYFDFEDFREGVCLLFIRAAIMKFKYKDFSFFSYFIQSRVLLSVAYLTVANLARLGILVQCQVSVRSQYLVRLLFQCWITGGHTIHPPIEGLLPPTGIEPTPF